MWSVAFTCGVWRASWRPHAPGGRAPAGGRRGRAPPPRPGPGTGPGGQVDENRIVL